MTQEQILQKMHEVVASNQNYTTWTLSTPHLVILVNQCIAEEREACAKLCEKVAVDSWTLIGGDHMPYMAATAKDCAKLIRGRNNT